MKHYTLEHRRAPYTWIAIASDDNLEVILDYAKEHGDLDDLRVMNIRAKRLTPVRELIARSTRKEKP